MRSESTALQLFVTPCTSMVDLNIIKDKKLIKVVHDVYKPKLIRLNSSMPGERYVIRVSDAEEYPWPNKIEVQVRRFLDLDIFFKI